MPSRPGAPGRRALHGLAGWLRPADLPAFPPLLFGAAWQSSVPLYLQLRLAGALAQRRASAQVLAAWQRRIALALPELGERETAGVARRYAAFRPQWALMQQARLPRAGDLSRSRVEGLEHVREALAGGRGLILVSAHFGHISATAHMLQAHGVDVWQVRARSSKRRSAERREVRSHGRLYRRLFRRLRGEPGSLSWQRVLNAEFNIRPLVDVLKSNGVLNLLGDGTNATRLVPATFLGQATRFAAGYVSIAQRTGSPVLPVFALEDRPPSGMKVVIEPPLAITPGEAGLEQAVRLFAAAWEAQVRRAPHLFPFWDRDDWFERRQADDD